MERVSSSSPEFQPNHCRLLKEFKRKRTCVDEDMFLEIRILVEFFRAEMAAERTNSRMDQAMCS